MLTQLVYNHALRIRVKADVDSSRKDSEGPSAGGPSKGSKNLSGKLYNLATSDVENILEGREFLQIRTFRCTYPRSSADLEPQYSPRFGSLLVYAFCTFCSAGGTSPMPALVAGANRRKRSAFVGLAIMIALLPVPRYVVAWMHKIQKRKMKMVSLVRYDRFYRAHWLGRRTLAFKRSRRVSFASPQLAPPLDATS